MDILQGIPHRREQQMPTVGSGKYTYTVIQDWAKLSPGETFAMVSAVATDSQDRVYGFQRKDPPIVIFDRNGNFLSSWGNGAFDFAHGISISNDTVYLTDRNNSVCLMYTLDGKPIQMLGRHGVHSDTGCERENHRIQVFTTEGQPITMWTDVQQPMDISRDREGVFYVSEGRAGGPSARISVLDGTGAVLARFDCRGSGHGSWVDAHGDIS